MADNMDEAKEIMPESSNNVYTPSSPDIVYDHFDQYLESERYQKLKAEMDVLLSNKTKSDLNIEYVNRDCDASTCACIQRIKVILSTYQIYINNKIMWRKMAMKPLIQQDNYGLSQFNGDFLHIKQFHPQIDIDFQCNIKDCGAKKRHLRARDQEEFKERALYFERSDVGTNEDICYLQECDKVHFYFAHTKPDTEDTAVSDGVQYSGKIEDEEWLKRFSLKCKSKRVIYNDLTKGMEVFQWQCSYGFTPCEHRGTSHLKPAFENVQQEALHNHYHPLSPSNWNSTYRKAKLFHGSWVRSTIKTKYDGSYTDQISGKTERWQRGIEMTLTDILVLKLYTDFDKLQFALKKCFRFAPYDIILDHGENGLDDDEYIKEKMERRRALEKRLKQFFHWRSALMIVLNKFGRRMRGKYYMPLYCGINSKMIISASQYAFYGPLSTTSSYHVARSFATSKGMVLKINSMYPRLKHCNAFDASCLSDYPEEKEWLVGFMYARCLEVTTRSLSDSRTFKYDMNQKVPLASALREEFFVFHLFKEQKFSLSAHLEMIMATYLRAIRFECCKNKDKYEQKSYPKHMNDKLQHLCYEHHDNGTNKIQMFGREYANKNVEMVKRAKILYPIIWERFNLICERPNLKQSVKFDLISADSDILKPFFMSMDDEKDIKTGKNKWRISFTKIQSIYPNVQEVVLLNNYKLDDKLLLNLVKHVQTKQNTLKQVKFLYYCYDEADDKGCPLNDGNFLSPKLLSSFATNRFEDCNWSIKYNKPTGDTGYKILLKKKEE